MKALKNGSRKIRKAVSLLSGTLLDAPSFGGFQKRVGNHWFKISNASQKAFVAIETSTIALLSKAQNCTACMNGW